MGQAYRARCTSRRRRRQFVERRRYGRSPIVPFLRLALEIAEARTIWDLAFREFSWPFEGSDRRSRFNPPTPKGLDTTSEARRAP